MNAHLVHVGVLLRICEHVEGCVQLIQHVDDLHGTARVSVSGAISAEPDNPGEQKCHAIVLLRWDWPRVSKLVCHGNWQHRVQQPAAHRQLLMGLLFNHSQPRSNSLISFAPLNHGAG